MMKNIKIHIFFFASCSAAIAIAFWSIFGMVGLRTYLGFLFLNFIPTYLILSNFVDGYENTLFSFFISLIFVNLFIWYINRIIPSMRVSMVVGGTLLYLAAFAIFKFRRKVPSGESGYVEAATEQKISDSNT